MPPCFRVTIVEFARASRKVTKPRGANSATYHGQPVRRAWIRAEIIGEHQPTSANQPACECHQGPVQPASQMIEMKPIVARDFGRLYPTAANMFFSTTRTRPSTLGAHSISMSLDPK